MLRQFRNLVLHDVTADHEVLLQNTGEYIKNTLLDKQSIESLTEFHDSNIQIVDDGHKYGLGNPQMLRLIFKYLKVRDLSRVRLVNLRWNAVACEIQRKKRDYTKIIPSQMKFFTKLMKSNITNPICSYAIRIDEISKAHIRQFLNRFTLDIINLRVRISITELPEFSKFLQKMRNLQILHVIIFDEGLGSKNHLLLDDFYEYSNASGEKSAWKLGLYSFNKVHSLIFESSDAFYKIHPFYDRVATNIISACSNLKALKFVQWNSPVGKLFSKFQIDHPGVVDTCRKFATTEDLTLLFFSVNLKFNVIRLEITPSVSFELVSDIIHKSGDSLFDLSIINEEIFERFAVSSVLRNLVRLKLNLWMGPVDFTYFTRQFPALRLLSLNLNNLVELERVQVSGVIERCPTLRTLILTRLEIGVECAILEKLAELFPAVKELFIEVRDGGVLQRIFELYPGLTLLSLDLNNEADHENSLTNQHFTGVPDDLVKVVYNRDCGCPVVEFPEEARGCWNIGCLKNLITLLLRVPNTVNNIALLEGISRLNRLENLVLLPFYYKDQEPTKWCLRSIADNFRSLKTLFTSHEITYSESDIQYIFRKIPKLIHRTRK